MLVKQGCITGFVSGYANLTSVEFLGTGQYGFVDPTDPRFSLAFVYLGDVEKSRVTNCSFVRGFSPAIGAFNTYNLTVKSNVFYHSIGHGIILSSLLKPYMKFH